MKIKIDAIDTLFFKDGKPFSMGEETWADGIFPPPPSVIYGAIRTAYFAENPNEFVKANTENDPTYNLVLKGINFDFADDEYYPIPLDYAKIKNSKGGQAILLKSSKHIPLSSSSLNTNFLELSGNIKEKDEEFELVGESIISFSSLRRYLRNESSEKVSFIRLSELVQTESKIGIGRDNITHSTGNGDDPMGGKLYRVGMKRLSEKKVNEKKVNSLSLNIHFEGLQIQNEGLLKLGAEGKVAKYKSIENCKTIFTDDELDEINETTFKVYLVNPAIFKKGWLPDFENNPILKELQLEQINASIGKPISIGGFDMVKKMPKPMIKAVPAGSVYYFNSKNSSFKEIYQKLNGKSISDYKTKEGYGICYIGRI